MSEQPPERELRYTAVKEYRYGSQLHTHALFIFDLDGTLALNGHRLWMIRGDNKRWDDFYENCDGDGANRQVIKTLRKLLQAPKTEVWIWSGRMDTGSVFRKTSRWLENHVGVPAGEGNGVHSLQTLMGTRLLVRMRDKGDYTPDEVLKREWLNSLHAMDRDRIVAVFDDRDKVVKMWREEGLTCFQVEEGDF